uniref:Putative ovule protein n=1 Tax=Solanum chacoense TaxID=4108 RepID=A0A0V0IYI3_SOLCH
MTTQLIEGRVELTQEINQFGSDIHDLEANLNKKIEASEAQLPNVVDDDQLVEQKEEFQPFSYTLFLNIDVEKECKSENVVKNVAFELKQLESHSKHFSISSELMDECIDEVQVPYILKFFGPRTKNDIPHQRAKKCKMQHILLGFFIFIPPFLERSRKIDAKLGVRFISSKCKEKW